MAKTNINNLIAITATGLRLASPKEVQNAIIDLYKHTHGKDIDVSVASADGIFIEYVALLIDNILSSYQSLYNNMDIDTAEGKALDVLCGFNNVKRKSETKATAKVKLTNNKTYDITINPSAISNASKIDESTQEQLLDQNGNIWYVTSGPNLKLKAGASMIVDCEYSESGSYSAPKGFIIKTVEPKSISVEQITMGTDGVYSESDDELRIRRKNEMSSNAVTVLQGLKSELLSDSSIDDVYIGNNNTSNYMYQPGDDKTGKMENSGSTTCDHFDLNIPAREIQISIKPKHGYELNRDFISKTIWNKLTPGVLVVNHTTHELAPSDFTSKYNSKTYYCSRKLNKENSTDVMDDEDIFNTNPEDFKSPVMGVIKGKNMSSNHQGQYVFWKECKAIHPTITCQFDILNDFNTGQLISVKTDDVKDDDDYDKNIKIENVDYSTSASGDTKINYYNKITDTSSTVASIANSLIKYLNNLNLYEDMDIDSVMPSIVLDSDPYNNGKRTIRFGTESTFVGANWKLENDNIPYNATDVELTDANYPTYTNETGETISSLSFYRNIGSYYYYNDWVAYIPVVKDRTTVVNGKTAIIRRLILKLKYTPED